MKHLIAACLVIATLPLSAAVPVEQAVELCRAEQNALRRLTCYDAIEVTNVVQSGSTSNISEVAAADAQAIASVNTTTAADNAADFGMEHRKAEEAPDQLYMTVKTVRYTPRKELIVEFENGQVWRQSNSGSYSISVGEQHYIKRGALNSFFLGNDETNRTLRVRREK